MKHALLKNNYNRIEIILADEPLEVCQNELNDIEYNLSKLKVILSKLDELLLNNPSKDKVSECIKELELLYPDQNFPFASLNHKLMLFNHAEKALLSMQNECKKEVESLEGDYFIILSEHKYLV